MKWSIERLEAEKTQDKELLGKIVLVVEGHKSPYEVTLHSKNGRDWSYSLNFAGASGPEEQIDELEEQIEEDDDMFDSLTAAIKAHIAK
ncbi:hypothetical protein [Paenibacillus thalictri]|uniref:Uncharacterized protein n=1 Tax=Paenibacillus thalictri TaxID=2527873 RepID=A0A4Q9DRZ8_9BACL|nr:hypothetical protein [Paenibacillus thalictri]TBL77820.1 hypothetical protein EYB31_16925 [Paenibacillus thalictri]